MELKIPKRFYHNKIACIKGLFLFIITLFLFIYSYCFDVDIKITLLFSIIEYIVFLLLGFQYKKHFLISPYFWFVSFYMLYSSTFPFLFEFGGLTYYGVENNSVMYTTIYGFRFLSILMLIFSFFHPYYVPYISKENINIVKKSNDDILVMAVIILLLVCYCFIFGGFYQFILAGETARTNLKNYVDNYNVWTLIGYLNIYLFIYILVYFKNISKTKRIIIMLPILSYFFVCLFTGSRKFILFLMVITICCTILKIIETKKFFIIIGIAILLSTFMRVVVMDKGFSGNIYEKIASMTGEFIFPYITFPLSIQKEISRMSFNYPTILDSILYFIPRKIFPLKNYSIGYTFSYRFMNVGMGFASTPLLEGYINFGNSGFLFEAFIIGILLFYTTKKAYKDFFLFLFATIFLIDLNRGEISYYIRQLIIISFMVFSIKRLIQTIKFKI